MSESANFNSGGRCDRRRLIFFCCQHVAKMRENKCKDKTKIDDKIINLLNVPFELEWFLDVSISSAVWKDC